MVFRESADIMNRFENYAYFFGVEPRDLGDGWYVHPCARYIPGLVIPMYEIEEQV